MNANMYLKTHSKERVQQVCDLAGIKPSWFSLCARGHGDFSIKVAIDLEAVTRILAELPDDYMTVGDTTNYRKMVDVRQKVISDRMTRVK